MADVQYPLPLPQRVSRRFPGSAARAAPWLAVLLLAVLLPLNTVCADSAETAAQQAKLKQLRARISDLKGELKSMHGKRDSLLEALEKTEKDIGAVAAALRRLDRKSEETREKIRTLKGERNAAQGRLDAMRAMLAKELRAAYLAGKQEQVKVLLNQEDPAAVGRMMVYHGYLTRARTARLQDIRGVLEELGTLEQELLVQQAGISSLREEQQEKSALLASEQDSRRKLLAKLQARLQDKTTELSALEEDEQRLHKLVQSLQQALRDIPPESGRYTSMKSLKGKLRWPVSGRVTQRYGARQASGKLRSRGVRIDPPAGTDVRAIAKGRVAFADWLRGFGLLLIIDHGDGYMSLYGQNSSLYKSVGEWVEGGEVVAATGSSGGQAHDGLYLELRKDGRPINPGSWFRGKPASKQAGR